MKLTKDVPGLLTKKWRRSNWPGAVYIQFDGIRWVWNDDAVFTFYENDIESDEWQEYVEPKKTKKIKMYCPIQVCETHYSFYGIYRKCKEAYAHESDIVGWHEIEVEVEE